MRLFRRMHIKNEAPICIVVHAVFANDAFNVLKEAGTDRIVTCNTIVHSSNDIDLSESMSARSRSL